VRNLRPKAKIVRVEYSISTKADCALTWRIFTDCARWHRFTNAYRSLEWRGEPWVPGSRLQIEIVRPVVATQDRVITICTPPRCVAWVNHVMGYTMEQWVLFDPDAGGGTRVSTWIEITGADLEGHNIEKMVAQFAADWLINFGAECDRRADGR
jgi:hypothetical protein